jgi:DNA-binding NarL/FixJ family response regulator
LSAVADIISSLFLHYSFSTSRYGLCVFVLSIAFMLARLYDKTTKELVKKNTLLANADTIAQTAWEQLFEEHKLTEREKEVARFMAAGLSNAEIAEQIFLSKATVGFHVTNFYQKFDIDGKSGGQAAFFKKNIRS